VNISNVVIKTEAMSEWRRYLKWRILTLAAGLGIMEVCSSNEMGAPNASHLEQETTQPNRPKQTKISPGKRTYIHEWSNFRLVGNPDIERQLSAPGTDECHDDCLRKHCRNYGPIMVQ
jgi:hypothetical protein